MRSDNSINVTFLAIDMVGNVATTIHALELSLSKPTVLGGGGM